MNFKLLTQKLIDFTLNLSVVAIGLAIFEQNWLGIPIGFFGLLIAIVMILRTKE